MKPKWNDISTFFVAIFLLSLMLGQPRQIFADIEQLPGWPQESGEVNSSPVAADLDGDGELEILIGSYVYQSPGGGRVFAWHADGSFVDGWPQILSSVDNVRGGITVADLDNDGSPEVIAPTNNSSVYVWHADGNRMAGWPQTDLHGVLASVPAVADLDGDGRKEIVIGTTTGEPDANWYTVNLVYAWHSDGTLVEGWPQRLIFGMLPGLGCSSPAIADFEGDELLEIVIACDIHVYAWHYNGTPVGGWPIEVGLQYTPTNVPIGSPAIADLDGDGSPEIIFASRAVGENGKLYVWHSDGSSMVNWPTPFPSSPTHWSVFSPVIGDIDGNGNLDIAVSVRVNFSNGIVYVWDKYGALLPGWPQTTQLPTGVTESLMVFPALADLDGDRKPEIIVGSWGYPGHVYAWYGNGDLVEDFPIAAGGRIDLASAAIADVDGNETLEIILPSYDDQKMNVWTLPNPSAAERMPWPMFQHDLHHTGLYPLPIVNSPPILSRIMDKTVYEGQFLQFVITASDPDGDSMTFNATGLPRGAMIVDNQNNTATFSWLIPKNFLLVAVSPSVHITVDVLDEHGASNSQSFTITVKSKRTIKKLGGLFPVGG
ncbi:MAG: VCBS repeat-containing protein [Candidatus Omnitrophica bacterium]|nr:VCBS repeat-containing protein [Candidatus Omnitrophota bacterium]